MIHYKGDQCYVLKTNDFIAAFITLMGNFPEWKLGERQRDHRIYLRQVCHALVMLYMKRRPDTATLKLSSNAAPGSDCPTLRWIFCGCVMLIFKHIFLILGLQNKHFKLFSFSSHWSFINKLTAATILTLKVTNVSDKYISALRAIQRISECHQQYHPTYVTCVHETPRL